MTLTLLSRAKASQGRLAELNPYVSVDIMTQAFDQSSKLDYLGDYQVVISIIELL